MLDKNTLGKKGEKIAAAYLKKSGYLIVGANIRIGRHEFDLIAKYKKRLIFVEVKTRYQSPSVQTENWLSGAQQSGLSKAIAAYAARKGLDLENIRLDLVIIIINKTKGKAELRHYRDLL